MKQRLEYIDILRGFAIFLVVLGHVLEHAGLKDDFLFYFIYSFHMPLFICISGFVSAYVYHDKLYINNINKMGGGKFILKIQCYNDSIYTMEHYCNSILFPDLS